MWLYREVLPVRRRRVRLWMIVPAAVLATAITAIALPRAAEPTIDQTTVIHTNVAHAAAAHAEAELASRLAEIDGTLADDRESNAQCDLHCMGTFDRLVSERRVIAGKLRALHGR